MYDLYEALVKGKPTTLTARAASYFSQFLVVDLSMFTVKVNGEEVFTDPEGNTLDAVWLEKYFVTSGSVGAKVQNGNIIITPMPSRYGQLDQYGDPKDAIGITRNGKMIDGANGDSIVIGYNQSSRWADLDLLYYPDVLARVDDAIDSLVQWSKAAPMITAPDSKTQTQIAGLITDLMNGIPKCVIDGDILTKMKQGTIGTVELTDPSRAALVQYFSELHDVLTRRFYTVRGLDTHKTSKHAQVTTDEADGQEVLSWVLPLDRLRCRQQFCTDMKNAFGVDMEYTFSPMWQNLYDSFTRKLKEQPDDGGDNNAAENSTDADDTERTDDSGSAAADSE